MRTASRETLIGSLRSAVNAWRKREGWSRETAVQQIVEHHAAHMEQVTGVVFDPDSRDPFDRMKANADRVYRWLDDETKDTNLLGANMVPSVLGALPLDLRLLVADEIMRSVGLIAAVSPDAEPAGSITTLLRGMIKECGEAAASMAGVLESDSPEALTEAYLEIEEAMSMLGTARAAIQRKRADYQNEA